MIRALFVAVTGSVVGITAHAAEPSKLLSNYPTLTTAAALQAAQAALAICDKDGYTVAVAVVDRGGHPLAVLRNGLAGPHTTQTAINKAYTALSFRTDTTELAQSTQANRVNSGIRSLPNVVAVGGGMMIRAKGSLVGAIGVSGAPGGDADDACAKAGIAAISDALELE
ncbi:MAG TPA: heme-binding protein [Casimicrobiaceae bacterium]|nr:heme-binding protein [Casimicrobiaceae bacterium]